MLPHHADEKRILRSLLTVGEEPSALGQTAREGRRTAAHPLAADGLQEETLNGGQLLPALGAAPQ